MEAIANPPAYQRARAAVRYDDVARTLVHSLKYQDRTDLAPTMGRWMARAGSELLDGGRHAGAGAPALAARLAAAATTSPARWRGSSARQSGVEMSGDALRRVRADRAADRPVARRSAPAMCRAPSRSPPTARAEIQGRRVVLVDDVLTSGATPDACARALLRAKAAQVDVLVFARVVEAPPGPHIIQGTS